MSPLRLLANLALASGRSDANGSNGSVCCGSRCARVNLRVEDGGIWLQKGRGWELAEGNAIKTEMFLEGTMVSLNRDFTWQSKHRNAMLQPRAPLLRLCDQVLRSDTMPVLWTALNATLGNSTQGNSTQVNSTQGNSTQGNSTQLQIVGKIPNPNGSGCGNTDFADSFQHTFTSEDYNPIFSDHGSGREAQAEAPLKLLIAEEDGTWQEAPQKDTDPDFSAKLLIEDAEGEWREPSWSLERHAGTPTTHVMPVLTSSRVAYPARAASQERAYPARGKADIDARRRKTLRAQFCFQVIPDASLPPTERPKNETMASM